MLSRNGVRQSVPRKGYDLASEWPFGEFRKDESDFGWVYGYKALDEFKDLKDKGSFVEPTFEFVSQEKNDRVRSWGMSILENIGKNDAYRNDAYRFIVQMLKTEKTRNEKRTYTLTCFFALKAAANLANSPDEKMQLLGILNDMWKDEEEDYSAQAGASVILAARHELADTKLRQQAMANVKGMLTKDITKGNDTKTSYWAPKWALRALQEFPIPQLLGDIIEIKRKDPKIMQHNTGVLL